MRGVVARSRGRRAGIVHLTVSAAGTLGARLVAPCVEDLAAVGAALLPAGAAGGRRRDPAVVADRLAVAVRRQWDAKVRARRPAARIRCRWPGGAPRPTPQG
ncbi:hypothetical protein AB5J55_08170 [Streptomyces sp. R11]|uniref:Uncharacterized protein n=1 Tax=Streptomyces sp. R11 TaxID=3238625 RepID=A0AB39MTJ1_9ACTN